MKEPDRRHGLLFGGGGGGGGGGGLAASAASLSPLPNSTLCESDVESRAHGLESPGGSARRRVRRVAGRVAKWVMGHQENLEGKF